MARTTWNEAVARARRAQGSHFKDRMEIADASLSVVPANGKGANGHTLAEFADEVDVSYGRLTSWRSMWQWLGRDFATVGKIPSLAVALEAMDSGRWSTGKRFIQEMDRNPKPTIEREGYQPYVAEQGWNRAVLRAYLGKPLTAEMQLMMTAVTEHREPTTDELYDAGVDDRFDEVEEFAAATEDAGALANAAARAQKSGRDLTGQAAAKTSTYVPSDDSQKLLSFKDQLKKLGAKDLPGRIGDDAARLLKTLEEVDNFRFKFGDAVIKADGDAFPDDTTLNELLDETLDNWAAKTSMAFGLAIGAPDRME